MQYSECVASLSIPVKQKNYLNPFTAIRHSTHKPIILCVRQVATTLAWLTNHSYIFVCNRQLYYSGLTQYSLSSQFAFVSCTSECPTGDPQTPTQDKQKPEKTRTKREFSYVAYDFFVIDRRLSTNLAWLGTDYPLSLLLLLIQVLELLQCLCCCELLCVAVDGFRMY